jgi:hypothetical protein
VYPELGHNMFVNVAEAMTAVRNWTHGEMVEPTPVADAA